MTTNATKTTATWQTYSVATAQGIQIGIGLYEESGDCTDELASPDCYNEASEANAALAKLEAVCERLNAA